MPISPRSCEESMPDNLAKRSVNGSLLDLCLEMAEFPAPEAFTAQFRAVRSRPNQSESLCGIAVPTLVLCGQENRLGTVDRHDFMHDVISGSRLVIVPGAGHMPTLEQPARTIDALREWLRAWFRGTSAQFRTCPKLPAPDEDRE